MVPFTQYLRPDGRKRAVTTDCAPEVEALAEEFMAAGGKYECEELTTGHVSLTAVYDFEDIAIEVCPNGSDVPPCVEKLIRRSVKWLKEERDDSR